MSNRKHAAHGEGSVYKSSDPKRTKPWVVQITANGRKRTSYYATQKEALAAKRKMLHELEMGQLVTARDQTVDRYLREWLVAKRNELSEGTIQYYQQYIEWHLIPHIGRIKLTRLTHADIQAMYPKLRQHSEPSKPLHPTVIRHVHSVLSSALNDAVEQGKIANNPCRFVKQPRKQKKEYVVLNFEQANRFLEVMRDSKYEAVMALALATGMREGELLALHWSDIDFKQGTVHVMRSLSRKNPDGTGYQFREKEPKSSASRRIIIIPSFALEILRKHRHRQKAQRLAASTWVDRDLVFPGAHGNWEHAKALSGGVKVFLQRAGLPEMRFHDLRHSAATLMLAMGVSPKVVSEILGHSDIKITLGIYTHVSADMQQDAANKLDQLLGRNEQTS